MTDPLSSLSGLSVGGGTGWPAATLVRLVRLYQRTASPVLTAITPGCGCRFTPSCSQYAIESVQRHGAAAGLGLALLRLSKCHPLHAGGWDPVPAPRCTRVAS